MNSELTVTQDNSYKMGCRLVLTGRVTFNSADILKHKLTEVSRKFSNIFLDMREVTFLSSAGIRVLLLFHKNAKQQGGRFKIERASENVANVIGSVALDELLA